MSIDNKEWLQATNDFSLLGIKFLYLSNGGAMVAILGNAKIFENCHYFLFWALTSFTIGLLLAFACNFFAYLLYRNILINEQNKYDPSHKEIPHACFMYLAIVFSILSCLVFICTTCILIATFLL